MGEHLNRVFPYVPVGYVFVQSGGVHGVVCHYNIQDYFRKIPAHFCIVRTTKPPSFKKYSHSVSSPHTLPRTDASPDFIITEEEVSLREDRSTI